MSPCVLDLAGVTVQVAIAGVVFALAVIALYALGVWYIDKGEQKTRRKAWHDRERG